MKNSSDARGNSSSQSRSDTQMKSGTDLPSMRNTSSESQKSDTQGSGRESGSKPQGGMGHTNAGNTGFSSGQISPSTQHAQSSGKSGGGPERSPSGKDRKK